MPVAEATLPENEPVIGLVINGDARAYPLRILIWHEIVNDVVGGVPVAITYALCATPPSCSIVASATGCWSSAARASCATRAW